MTVGTSKYLLSKAEELSLEEKVFVRLMHGVLVSSDTIEEVNEKMEELKNGRRG